MIIPPALIRIVTRVSLTVLSASIISLSAFAKPPNIVFILIDDLGWMDVSCYGSEYYETPQIDSLAQSGALFSDFYTAAPVCSPTRASILTGKYPARIGLTGIIPRVPPLQREELTIAERLKSAGYVTAMMGKWHLGGPGYLPEDQGFDINIGGTHAGMPLDYFYPGWEGENKVHSAKGSVPITGKEGEYLTDRLTDEAVDFIRSSKDKPFFLYLSHFAVHTPIQAKGEYVNKYRKKSNIRYTQRNPIYAAMIESVDDSVGKVLHALKEVGVDENTVVIFTSDNGGLSTWDDTNTPATNNAPLLGGKGYLYEGGIRAPLIVRWPGVVNPGIKIDTPTISNDLFPTMIEMAGFKPTSGEEIDGCGLTALLQGVALEREALYWHYPHRDIDAARPGGVIRRGDYKLIEFYDDHSVELYNLKTDIEESVSLAETLPELTAELQKMLGDWRNSLGVKNIIE